MALGTHSTFQVGYKDYIGIVTPRSNHIFPIFPQSGKNEKKLEVKVPKRNELPKDFKLHCYSGNFYCG